MKNKSVRQTARTREKVRDKSIGPDEVTIRLHIERLEEGGYVATSPDVPGLIAEGRSVTETVEIAQAVVRKIAESCLEHGDPLPPALAGNDADSLAIDLLVPVGVR